MKLISKSQFLDYLTCPKDAWFRIHKPELKEFEVSDTQQKIFDQGYEAEDYAKQLKIFDGMKEVTARNNDTALKEVDVLMAKKTPSIYQATFIADGYIIRCDVIKWDEETDKWDPYEIKSSTKRHDTGARDHISDAAFQAIVMERYGVLVGKTFIVHLNGEYVRNGDLDIESLFTISDCTAKVVARRVTVAPEMEEAKKYLNQEGEPKGGCDCIYSGRSSHCATASVSHEIPEYSVHDLAYIGHSPNKLRKLVEQGIYHMHDIEDTSELTDKQQNQIAVHKSGKEIIDKKEIENVLNGYAFPLYFLDYETFAPAIPLYDGFSPYKRMPIQFSLHYIKEKGGSLEHNEYLHEENSDPSETVAKLLCDYIDPSGTVLAWNVGFERSVTNELALRVPEYAKTLQRICGQMQDLMDIFSNQHYVHQGFRGRVAIESVMNALLPEMSYDHLPYTGQDVGFVWWNDIVNAGPTTNGREKKIHLIKEYCKQDTRVMVEIWRILNDIINK